MIKSKAKVKRILLITGGTGGHVFPAVAVAEYLKNQGIKATLLTDQRGMAYIPKGVPTQCFEVHHPKTLRGIRSYFKAFMQVMRFLKRNKFNVAIGFGGYMTLPGMLACWLKRIPLLLHEQNAVLGRVHRICAYVARCILTSIQPTLSCPKMLASKCIHVGNPTRKIFAERRPAKFLPRNYNAKTPLTILIIGGSQAANIFTHVVPEAVALLDKKNCQRLHIIHQAPTSAISELEAHYKTLGISALVAPFFGDIADHMINADLVISRAGSSSIFELAMLGKPSILIPLPHAQDNHQYHNAQALAAVGGCIVIAQNKDAAKKIHEHLGDFFKSPTKLNEMGSCAYRFATTKTQDHFFRIILQIS